MDPVVADDMSAEVAQAYKQLKEQFVSDLHGTSEHEVFLLLLILPVRIALTS